MYFQDAQENRAGAPARLAGVDVGKVSSVNAHPDLPKNPTGIVAMSVAGDPASEVCSPAVGENTPLTVWQLAWLTVV